nr:unnamed protein product [Digitaria exilis]
MAAPPAFHHFGTPDLPHGAPLLSTLAALRPSPATTAASLPAFLSVTTFQPITGRRPALLRIGPSIVLSTSRHSAMAQIQNFDRPAAPVTYGCKTGRAAAVRLASALAAVDDVGSCGVIVLRVLRQPTHRRELASLPSPEAHPTRVPDLVRPPLPRHLRLHPVSEEHPRGQEPAHYFADRYDLVRFVKQAGLFVHLRISPCVCAEWNFPI